MPRIQLLKPVVQQFSVIRAFARTTVDSHPGWFNQKVCGNIIKILVMRRRIQKTNDDTSEILTCVI